MKARVFSVVVASLLTLVFSGTVRAQSVAAILAPNFAGVWKGECLYCKSDSFSLNLSISETGIVTGTIKVKSAASSYGEDEKVIKNARIQGKKITFESGNEGARVFFVELKISDDGEKMVGIGTYDRSFTLKFKRM